jgi:hypothetical protein
MAMLHEHLVVRIVRIVRVVRVVRVVQETRDHATRGRSRTDGWKIPHGDTPWLSVAGVV